ncbi:MFS transporter [Streptomyces sp. G45]|uniref:MFS transporter n=1 Tax=Streptomyces sp. G45 TaxID=3406627 RepID=UPI003C254C71
MTALSVAAFSYRDLTTRELLLWGLAALASKAPVAMAPLALVFLTRQGPGGYALGATLASVYVAGEVVGAPLLGARLGRGRTRRSLAAGLAAGALAFCALPFAASAPAPVPMGLAFLAGAAPAACPGGLRALLTGLVADGAVPRALSVESTLTQITWAVAPGLVVLLALHVHAGAPLVLGALLAATATLPLLRLPEPREPPPDRHAPAPLARTLLTAWPVYLTGAASMAMLASAELVLPALLERRGAAVGWAGPLLAGFALASAAGALCYGLRTWPGSAHTQSLVLLTATAGGLALVAVAPGVPGVAAALAVTGVLQSGAMVTRNLSLRAHLPAHAHAAAYSVLYAVGGVGYSAAASLSAVALEVASPTAALLTGVGVMLLVTAVSAVAEARGTGPTGRRSPGSA